MSSWFLAPCLDQLRDEVDARWPKRSKKYDGTIGDAAHAARKSEHNPNRAKDDVPDGAVTAIDITATDSLLRAAVLEAAIGHPNVWYVINKGKIYSRTYGFKPRDYAGPNPHNSHIHVSCVQAAKNVKSRMPWLTGGDDNEPDEKPVKPVVKKLPVLSRGDSHELVPVLKRFFGISSYENDPKFGHALERNVARYQRQQGLTADGVVGPKTWARILTALKLEGWEL